MTSYMLGVLVQYDTMSVVIILVGHCDIFHGPEILLNISNTILWIYIILEMLFQCDTMSELIYL